ncbi:MAG: carboxypeptidase regulatory-like domain-containing protein [Planctomycetota bacterium]|jgi:5-hydroxyisourate hydrolase-like protein (transthyretin family)
MKRVALILGLAVGLVAVVMLLLSMGDDDPSRQRLEVAVDADGDSPTTESESDQSVGADGEKSGTARDDDPNRIDGPEVVVRGVVLLGGKPVAGAKVQLRRSQPSDPALRLPWNDPRSKTESPAPLAETEADEDGRFLMRAARRTHITVGAYHDGTGYAEARLFVPKEGDPGEVTINLHEGYAITGIVIDEKGEPAEGVKLTCASGGYQSYPFLQTAETGADGKFGFGTLGRSGHTLTIEKEGYPTLQRSFSVPQIRELQVELVVGGELKGTLKDDGGAPIVDARLLLRTGDTTRSAAGYVQALTDAQGAYAIPLAPPGAIHSAVIEHDRWGRRTSTQGDVLLPQTVVKSGETATWDIELKSGVTVRGTIVDRDTGKPVPDARITLLRNAAGARNYTEVRHERSDTTGRFAVEHILEGTYAIEVKAAAHYRPVARWVQPNQQMVNDFFSDGVNDPDAVRIEVGGSARVEGHILGDMPNGFGSSWIQIPDMANQNTRSDATGFFVFEHVLTGKTLKLKCWTPTCESEEFTLATGETKIIDLDSDEKPQFRGTVVGSDGNPVAGAYVKAAAESMMQNEFLNILSSGSWGSARTDAEGKFSIRLQGWQMQQFTSQKWAIAAVSYKYPLQVKTGIRVPKSGDTQDVHIVLEAGGKISGMIEFEGSGPATNVRVNVSPKYESQAARAKDPRQSRYVYTDLAGRFEVEGIGTGDWTVTTYHPDGKAEAQVATAGDTGVKLVIKATLAIAGVVWDDEGKPLARVRIAAIMPEGNKEKRRWATTDQSGRFRIPQLEAGEYALEVAPTQNRNLYYGGAQQTHGFKKTRTKPYPAGSENVVVEVEPGNLIKGRVEGPSGKPLGGAGVMAMSTKPPAKPKPGQPYRPNRGGAQPSTFTNGKGEFTLKGVEDGEYEIVVIASGYQVGSVRANVGQEDVVVPVESGGTIEGLLLAPDGSPLSNQWFNLQPQEPETQKKFQRWQSQGNAGWNAIGGWQAQSGSTKSDGTFKIAGLTPGRYKMTIYSQRGVVPPTELHTGAGKVTIRLREGMTVTGRVVTEAGVAPELTTGQIHVSAHHNGQWSSTQPDSDGSFELKGLSEGKIKIQVWAGNEYLPTSVEVQAGDSNVRIELKKRPPPQPK